MKQETAIDDRPEVTRNARRTSEDARQPYDSPKLTAYGTPKLTAYGTLADLTGAMGNVGSDGLIGSMQKV